MDEETQAWCEANGFTGHTVKALITEEFVSMQAIRAMTADVIASFSLSSAQRCLLRKAVLKSQSPPPLPPPVPTSTTKDADEMANDLDVLESSILALAQQKDAPTESTKTGEGKPSKSIPRAHEAIYIKPRSGKSDSKVNPLDLTYSEFTAGYFSILDGLLQCGEHAQAQHLCRYLKFLSKKAIAFSTAAILQFDDEVRGMVGRGEAAYDDHTSLNHLQAHHFDSSAVKAPNVRPRDRSRKLAAPSLSANTATNGTKILITVADAITPTRVSCATPRSMALCFIALNLLLGKNLPLIDQLIHLWQRPTHPHQPIFLHRTLQIQICSASALLRDILILGVAKWTLTRIKPLFFRALRMVFILSTIFLLFRQRIVTIIGAPKILP